MDTAPKELPPVIVSTLWHNDPGRIKVYNFPIVPEVALAALVSEPREAVKLLGGEKREGREKIVPLEDELIDGILTALESSRGDDAAFKAAKARIPSWVPAEFTKGSRRTKATCVGRQIIGHDFDRLRADTFETAVERVKAMLPGRFLAIHTTASVRKPDGSWCLRAYEILDRAATPEEWEARVKPHMRSLGESDDNALDVSRLLYLPLPTEGYRFAVVEGARTPLDRLPIVTSTASSTPATSTTSTAPVTSAGGATEQVRTAAANLLGTHWPAKGRHGAQLALAGALRHEIERGRLDWTREDALEFLCYVCRVAGDEDRPKREATIDHTWSTSKVTGWPTLESHVNGTIVAAARDMLRGSYVTTHDEEALEHLAGLGDAKPANDEASDDDPTGLGFETGAWEEEPPPVEFLVDGLLPKDSVSIFYGWADSLKTWLVYSLGVAMAKGEAWLGRAVTRPLRVAIVDYETGRNNSRRRLYKLGAGACPNLSACYFHAGEKPNRPEFWKKLAKGCFDVVIIDSLRRANPGADENDSGEAIVPIELSSEFSEAAHCAVIWIHHSPKQASEGWPTLRGASSIRDQVDCAYAVRQVEKSRFLKRVEVKNEKPGDMVKPEPFAFEVSFDDENSRVTLASVFDDAKPSESGDDEKKEARTQEQLEKDVLFYLGANEPVASIEKIREGVKAKDRLVRAAVKELEGREDVAKLRAGYVTDNETKRWARLRAVMGERTELTKADLSKKAFVKGHFIDRMVEEKRIRMNGADENDRGSPGYHVVPSKE